MSFVKELRTVGSRYRSAEYTAEGGYIPGTRKVVGLFLAGFCEARFNQ